MPLATLLVTTPLPGFGPELLEHAFATQK